ncbi:aminotransferase class V-fold PLP-dependent enzyme [Novosphingopyxis sp. YJ-S2-01]|uniref:cysteine desulfurase family protein n=1 Tax=Novosphingopyxis sp. YJ-S2-01 TaxID=2794021 RepID=UPI0018DC5D44|nr:aminotransferase class V-fold PLP-dependent enzyme [Novosphingopyxis sp. YJ-S2-01]
MTEAPLYLDHAATTPVLPAVRAAMAEAMEQWANPSSPHAPGRAAGRMLEDARARIAAALGWDGEVILTSGASEAIGIALGRAARSVHAIGATEHDAVLRAAPQADMLPVGADGIVDFDHLSEYLAHRPNGIIALQQANNETGVIQPLDDVAQIARLNECRLFADCSQSAGKMPLPDADLIAVSAHKLGGPPGIGALLLRDLSLLTPSGGQEKGYRGGTQNLPAAVGFAVALEQEFGWLEEAVRLRAMLDNEIAGAGGEVVAADSHRLPTIASYRMPGKSSQAQLVRFDMAGIAVSAGSACSSGTIKPSHVLTAMGWDAQAAGEVVRVSFGPQTSEADVERFVRAWRVMTG